MNVINIIVGLLLGVAHIYIPFTSIFGLVFGVVTAISGSIMIGISYYFTAKNTPVIPKEEKPPTKHSLSSNIFLALSLPVIALNSIASFFGMYTGVLLVATAVLLPISPPAVLAIAIILGIVMAVGTFINSWLQIHNIWEGLKDPVIQPSIIKPADTTHFLHKKLNIVENGLHSRPEPVISTRPRSSSLPISFPAQHTEIPVATVANSNRLH